MNGGVHNVVDLRFWFYINWITLWF